MLEFDVPGGSILNGRSLQKLQEILELQLPQRCVFEAVDADFLC